MALHFLLDEHLSPDLAVARLRPEVRAIPMRDWTDGLCLGAPDEVVLAVAYQQRLTLVTYDLRTIVPLLKDMAERGVPHGGVVLVDQRTIAPNDIGGLAWALADVWQAMHQASWINRVVYLAT